MFFVITFCGLYTSLPIHSCVDSFSFMCNLQYWNDSIIPLCCGQNFSLKTLSSPVALWHISALVRVYINCNPSQPNHLFIMGTFSSSLRSYVFDCSTFAASILKFNSSTYLSSAFHSKAGWLGIGAAGLNLRFFWAASFGMCFNW